MFLVAGLEYVLEMLTKVAAGAISRAVRCCARTGQDFPRACGALAARKGVVSARSVHTKDTPSPPELTKGADLLEITKTSSDEKSPSSQSPSPSAAALESTSPAGSDPGIISIDTSGLFAGSMTPKKELPKEMLTELGMLLYAYLRQVRQKQD